MLSSTKHNLAIMHAVKARTNYKREDAREVFTSTLVNADQALTNIGQKRSVLCQLFYFKVFFLK